MPETIGRLAERIRTAPEQRAIPVGTIRAVAPATLAQLERTESRLGFALAPLLRRAYLEVANGGFGPGYGVMGVDGGFTNDLKQSIADCYEAYRQIDPEDPAWLWPEAHVPICHWGCVIYSIIDCRTTGNPVYWADVSAKAPGEPMSSIIRPHRSTFDSWLGDWLDGKDLWQDVGSS